MFRHRGKRRTYVHNLKLASVLSFVAGMVNVTGLFAVHRLTTNLTGHFAFFADELSRRDLGAAVAFLFFILSFLLGAFVSNFLVEGMSVRNARLMYVLPIILEMVLLTAVGFLPSDWVAIAGDRVACVLLFAMGMQNALVTTISGSVVRTTHLTGLFTDLGIELSQFFFFSKREQQKKLWRSVQLRMTIILFFFLGGIAGGLGYLYVGIRVILLGVLLLLVGLIYDTVKFQFVQIRRRLRD